jgi:hypothetical protein
MVDASPTHARSFHVSIVTAVNGVSVTPHDSTNLPDPCDLLWIGTGGNVSVLTLDGATLVYTNVPAGYLFQACKRVNSTGTTATGIMALYAREV